METGNATALAAAGEREERPQLQPHARIDWRTGRPMLVRGAAFWQEHAARRIEQGLSVTAYCEANDLAKSTFRRYASANKAGPQRTAALAQPGGQQPSRFVAVRAPAATAEAEAQTLGRLPLGLPLAISLGFAAVVTRRATAPIEVGHTKDRQHVRRGLEPPGSGPNDQSSVRDKCVEPRRGLCCCPKRQLQRIGKHQTFAAVAIQLKAEENAFNERADGCGCCEGVVGIFHVPAGQSVDPQVLCCGRRSCPRAIQIDSTVSLVRTAGAALLGRQHHHIDALAAGRDGRGWRS